MYIMYLYIYLATYNFNLSKLYKVAAPIPQKSSSQTPCLWLHTNSSQVDRKLSDKP